MQLQGLDLGHLGPGRAAFPGISRRFHALPRSAARRLGRARGPGRDARRRAEMAASRATGNSRPRISAATPITISATARSTSPGSARGQRPPRHAASADVARKLHVCIPDRGHQTIHLSCCRPDETPPPAYQNAPIVAEYFRHCEEERRAARRLGSAGRRAWRDISEHRAVVAPAAHDGGVASARPAPDRVLALVLRRPRGAEPRSRSSCATITSATPDRPG